MIGLRLHPERSSNLGRLLKNGVDWVGSLWQREIPDARHPNPQRSLRAIADLEEQVPRDHPLRRIKAMADAALERLSPEFDRMYA